MARQTDLFDGLPAGSGRIESDVVSADDLAEPDLDRLFELADRCRSTVQKRGGTDLLEHRLMAAVFYEPSTRTASSFIAAMKRLGGGVIPLLQGASATSAAKGESLRDTAKTLQQYADVLVLRHPDSGAAREAADAVEIPVFNAGDGSNEHPTQALLDVFTMQDEFGDLDRRTVVLSGDLKFGRTVHSLIRLLRHYEVEVRCVSPEALRLPTELRRLAADAGLSLEESRRLEPTLHEADVVYMTRIQEERFDDRATYERLKGTYELSLESMDLMREEAILMHPLPRVGEIAPEVDDDPRAVYFDQAQNGMFVRMALLADALR